jgi:dynein light chain LC8-type
MSDRKAVIKNADMSEEMQQDAVDCATQAMEKYNIEKDIAAFIKREFDKKYNPTWHCIVGRNFGSYVTHETKVCAFVLVLEGVLLLLDPNPSLAHFPTTTLSTSSTFTWGKLPSSSSRYVHARVRLPLCVCVKQFQASC